MNMQQAVSLMIEQDAQGIWRPTGGKPSGVTPSVKIMKVTKHKDDWWFFTETFLNASDVLAEDWEVLK